MLCTIRFGSRDFGLKNQIMICFDFNEFIIFNPKQLTLVYEFNIESALEMKNYMVNDDEVRKNVSALKNETEKLKTRLIERDRK